MLAGKFTDREVGGNWGARNHSNGSNGPRLCVPQHAGKESRLNDHGIDDDFSMSEQTFSVTWRSLTPCVSTRHSKTFRDGRSKVVANGWQNGSPGHDLLRLLALLPNGAGAEIRCISESTQPSEFGQRRFRSLQFLTQRRSGNAFVITFPKAVSGPLAFGYGAHFGLGLFQPVSPPLDNR
jgi:CRISPR-associated protein Csb2